MVFELIILSQREDPHIEFSKYFRKSPIYRYCSWTNDIIIMPKRMDKDIKKGYEQIFKEELTSFTENKSLINEIVVKNCIHQFDTSIVAVILKVGGIIPFPIKIQNGVEYIRIICIDNEVMKNVLNAIQSNDNFEIKSINDLGSSGVLKLQQINTYDLLENVTDKQLNTLVLAYQSGYYAIPRKSSAQDLAEEIGISSYGAQKLLRNAENKLMEAIIPYLISKQVFQG